MKFKHLKKKLRQYEIEWDSDIGKGSHGGFVGLSHTTRIRQCYPLPKSQQSEVNSIYLKPLRRAFELLPEDGISDDEFFS